MASSIPSEAIILIGVIIAAVALSQSFITSMAVIQQKTISSTASMGDKLNTDVKVIYAAKSDAFVKIWVKNIGTSTIYNGSITDSDVFFGKEGSFQRYDYGLGWTFTLLQGTDNSWRPGETIEINLTPAIQLDPGEYYARYVTHNGVKSEIFFSLG
jgi:archaellum component FlaG (FlaF/FlaG flagellin family)